jgi:hypothetical protein
MAHRPAKFELGGLGLGRSSHSFAYSQHLPRLPIGAVMFLVDFDGFLRDRAGRLLNLIEQATGKQVTGRDSDETIRAFAAAV